MIDQELKQRLDRLEASQNLGGNSNINFYMARNRRAVMTLNRRAMLTEME